MENDGEKFFFKDQVATVSSNTGQVKYGLILTVNRPRSETEVNVIWHPKGAKEIISDDKVYYLYIDSLNVLKLEL